MGSRRVSQVAYALYDWASSPVPTLHATFVFAVYFVSSVSPQSGTVQWAWMTAVAAIVVALVCPFIGARADARASRKLWLGALTLTGAIATACLWWVSPEPSWIWPALALSLVSIVALESTYTTYNALLPSVCDADSIGRVSGWAWAAGYFGAIASLLLVLMVFILPETPPLGLDKSAAEHVRITMPLVALWFIVFSVPTFVWVPEGPAEEGNVGVIASLREGFQTALTVPGLLRFLLVRMLYADGLVVLFAFGGIYASKVFGFTQNEVIMFAIAINITAGIGAAAMGWLDDRVGGFQTVRISLMALTVLAIVLMFAPNRLVFWPTALALGFFIGPVQSASRTVVARVVPGGTARADLRVLHDLGEIHGIRRPSAVRRAGQPVRDGAGWHYGAGRIVYHQPGVTWSARARETRGVTRASVGCVRYARRRVASPLVKLIRKTEITK